MCKSRKSRDTFISTGASMWNQYNVHQDLSFKLSRLKSRSASSIGASPWHSSSCFMKVWSNWLFVCHTCSAVFKLGSIKGPILEAKSSSNSAWDLSNLGDEKELHCYTFGSLASCFPFATSSTGCTSSEPLAPKVPNLFLTILGVFF